MNESWRELSSELELDLWLAHCKRCIDDLLNKMGMAYKGHFTMAVYELSSAGLFEMKPLLKRTDIDQNTLYCR
jgi:hypothetical protein